jgi:hypothetical protein
VGFDWFKGRALLCGCQHTGPQKQGSLADGTLKHAWQVVEKTVFVRFAAKPTILTKLPLIS